MIKLMRLVFITVAAFTLVALSADDAVACSCAERVPCQAYGEAAAVFIGTVIDSRIVTTREANFERRRRLVRLAVDSPFRGVKGSELEVITGLGGGDCGFGFVPTEQYLVYASEHEGKFYTSICSRTRSISRATEDLEYIRGLGSAKPGAAITGKVVSNRRTKSGGYENLPLANIKLTIEGRTKGEMKTNMKGQFRFEGLPAGSYEVKVSVPDGLQLTGTPDRKVEVKDRGCAVVHFWLEPARKSLE